MRILVAEDESELNRLIKRRLEDENYAVDSVFDGKSALEYLETTDYDLAILDIMMPYMSGLEVLRQYRESEGKVPVLFLTARDAVSDRVEGLDSGADDYLVKPFSFQELLARIRVIFRRNNGEKTTNVLKIGDLSLDLSTHCVQRAGRNIDLSAREFSILEYMMLNEGRVLTRESFRSHIWSWDYEGESNVVDVYIRFLRKKIDDPDLFQAKLIHTVRGHGYMLKAEDE